MIATLEKPETAEQYHADTSHVSHSMLEVFLRSQRLYHARFVTKTIEADEPTPAMVLGSALHLRVFQPSLWASLVAVVPEGIDRRTKEGKSVWAEFLQQSNGKMVVTQDQDAQVAMMADAIEANETANRYLSADGESETSVRWTDSETGLPLKMRMDRLSGSVVMDLKTASDPSPEAFARSAHNYGYHRQAAFYLDGCRAALEIEEPVFVHIVVGTAAPFDVAVYRLNNDAIELGRREVRQALTQLKMCANLGVWENSWSSGINDLSLPRWAFTKGER